MRKIVIILAVVLMIAGGAVSVMKALELGPFAPKVDGQADAANDEPKLPDEPPKYVEMDPMVIPIFSGDRVAAQLQIQLKLETYGSDNESLVTRLLPRIYDAFLRDLYVFLPRHIRKEEQIKVATVKRRLEQVARKVAGKGVVHGVLIQSVVDHARP